MATKKPVTDSEGNRVVTAPTEEPKEEPTVNAGARAAFEDEVAKDAEEAAKDAEEQERANAEAWQAFITRS